MSRPKTSLERRKQRTEELASAGAPGFRIDLQGAPYSVVCPLCLANALAPCRERNRRTRVMTVVEEPHEERWRLWKKLPKSRHVIGYYCPTADSPRADGQSVFGGPRGRDYTASYGTGTSTQTLAPNGVDKNGKILRGRS